MKGTVVINADAGRALRMASSNLTALNVLECSGSFHSGDDVYVVSRNKDGGQYVIAVGVARLDATILKQVKGRVDLAESPLVFLEKDLVLLWRS